MLYLAVLGSVAGIFVCTYLYLRLRSEYLLNSLPIPMQSIVSYFRTVTRTYLFYSFSCETFGFSDERRFGFRKTRIITSYGIVPYGSQPEVSDILIHGLLDLGVYEPSLMVVTCKGIPGFVIRIKSGCNPKGINHVLSLANHDFIDLFTIQLPCRFRINDKESLSVQSGYEIVEQSSDYTYSFYFMDISEDQKEALRRFQSQLMEKKEQGEILTQDSETASFSPQLIANPEHFDSL